VTLLAFRRFNDAPPPERELLTIEDGGAYALWRSIGPVVGRFGGRVPELEALRRLVEATSNVAAPDRSEFTPDASVEELEVGDVTATVEADDRPEGPWGELFAACRRLLAELTDQPIAAVAATIESHDRLRLDHRGTEALPLELEFARAELRLWSEGQLAATAVVEGLGPGRVEAGPGWSLTVEAPGIEADAAGILTAAVSLVADDGGVYVPLEVAPPAMTRPSGTRA
jgi:hypothetical protein